MKHTFVFIDKLIILLKDVPRSLDTQEAKDEAHRVLDEIEKYALTLKKLIESHKEQVYLKRLHDTHIAQIEAWADKVAELFRKLDSLLDVIETDVVVLRNVIDNEPEQWVAKVSNMALGMVMTGLHDEEEEMERFRRIAIFEIHELKEIIEEEDHIADLLE